MDPQSPEWWLSKLGPRLSSRWNQIKTYEDYYEGRQPLAFATTRYREEFSRMLRDLSDNWCELVVDAVEERLHIEGFRFGDTTAGDKDAWAIWQRNELDADSEIAHSTCLTTSVCPVMVWAGDDGLAEITVEHPSQVYVAYAPGSRRKRVAAIKIWADEWDNTTFANIYTPDGLWLFKGPRSQTGTSINFSGAGWDLVEEYPNPLRVVPVVEIVNRPKLLAGGRSEIVAAISTQDQINKLVCDMMVAAEFGAYRQRWGIGIELPIDPETGKETEKFAAAVDRLWHTPNDQAKFGEFSQTDLSNFVTAIENRVTSLAARTRTPPHYLLGKMVNISGDGMKAAETGLIAKANSRMRHYGERWEEIQRLAFAVEGNPRAGETAAETIWRDPESRSESEHIDSLVKKLALKVPLVQLWEDAGYTPTQIGRFRTELAAQAALEALAQVTSAVPQDLGPAPVSTGNSGV